MSKKPGQSSGKARSPITDKTSRQTIARDPEKGEKTPSDNPVGAASSANSDTADPVARHQSLDKPVGQITRHN